jgi:2-isopropylmalate synthase
LFDDAYVRASGRYVLGDYVIERSGDQVRIEVDLGGAAHEGRGRGALEALCAALARGADGAHGTIEAFDEYALTGGTTATAMACVQVQDGERVAIGVAFAEDATRATLQAVLTAFGKATQVTAEPKAEAAQ